VDTPGAVAAGPSGPRQKLFTLRTRYPWVLPLILAAILVLAPQLGISTTTERQLELMAVWVLITSGLNLSLGYAGELNLGQVFMYAAGAYVAGIMGVHGVTDIILQFAVVAVVAVVAGIVSGVPGLRLGGWPLAMTSFFLVLLITPILRATQRWTGGSQGLNGILHATIFGSTLTTYGFYVVTVGVVIVWLWVKRNLVTSRHGTAFRVLRQSPVLAQSLGISVYRMKLAAYAIGAIPAGLAGVLFANLDHYLSPGTFSFAQAITVVAASVIGGSTSIYGAVIGGVVVQLLTTQVAGFGTYRVVVYGGLLVVFGVLLGSGITGVARAGLARLDRLLFRRPVESAPADPIAPVPGVRLSVTGIGKSFGGNRALDGVSLTAEPGRITALIGPNGSGKTTLLNMICGYYRLDEGTVSIGDQVRSRRAAPHDIARAGVARTFQTANIPAEISVHEVVRSGRYTAERSRMIAAILRLPAFYRVRQHDTDEAMQVLRQVGIARLANQEGASLPLGTRRLLEVARALVRRPGVLLLDEVASGLDEQEVEQLADLIRRIRDAGGTVILVEHNFRLVLELADVIYVLAEGRVIATGSPEEIQTNPRVLEEYLGVRDEAKVADFEAAIKAEAGE
jgi:branched-chain amino acid transport system permease protein